MREHLAWALLALSCTRARPTDAAPAPDPASASVSVSAPVSAPGSVSVSVSDTSITRASGPYGLVLVPPAQSPAPILYLHGKWATPEDSCSFFERAILDASPPAAFLCPRGNLPSASGGGWGGALADERRSLDEALEAAHALSPSGLGDVGVAMGFSSGAAFAVKLALAEPGRWSGLVLMSMVLPLDAAKLRAAGVKRVVLAAGELDGSYASMVANAKRLNAAGLEARFVSLGKVGHHFAVDMETRMIDVVSWARGGP